MLEKKKKYSYEELKEIFEKIEMEVIINPFGDNQEKSEKKLDGQAQFMAMMIAMSTLHTLKEKLFGKEND